MTTQHQVYEALLRVARINDPSLIVNMMDHVVELRGSQPFLHLDEKLPYPGLGTSLTAVELRDFVNRIGNVLLAAGLQRGQRVAIFKRNAPDYALLGLAIIKAGGVAVPINPNMGLTDLSAYIEYTGSSFLITDETTYTNRKLASVEFPRVTWVFPVAPAGFKRPHIDLATQLPSASATLAPVAITSDTPIYLAHTSGTTGFPKGVIAIAGAFTTAMKGLLESVVPNFNTPFRQLKTNIAYGFPFHHIISNLLINCALMGSAQVYTSGDINAERTLRMLEREKIEYYAAFPREYHAMYEHGLEHYNLSRVKIWWSASDASHEVHMRAFAERGAPGCLFLDVLGTSEIGTAALVRAMPATAPLEARRLIGMPRPGGPKVLVADEHGREVPAGTVGRLMVSSPTLFAGYWNAHDKYVTAVNNGWFWTGDASYMDEQGRFYHLDRQVDVIETRGGPVYSLLLEERLMTHPDVGDAAVFGVPHPAEGTAPVAVVYLRDGRTATGEAIRAWNNNITGAQKLHAVFVVNRDTIPRGVTGKVLKYVLRSTYETTFAKAASTTSSAEVSKETVAAV